MPVHVLDAMSRGGFEEIIALHHGPSGLRGFLALHDTSAGAAYGGIRRWQYQDERRALLDCMRLARSMTHKCALAGIEAGGAKLVLIDHAGLDLPAAYRHIGQVVERCAGRFYTGPDVGTGPEELGWVAEGTGNVTDPGPEGPGDLAEATSAGVFAGMEAALRHLDGEEDWSRRRVVIQGLGAVGGRLAQRLRERGASVVAAEIESDRALQLAAELELELAEPGSELDQRCDIFSPCAMGGVVHDVTLKRMQCRIVAGGANNILARPVHGDRLHEQGVLYLPDVVINAGALIRGAGFHMDSTMASVPEIEKRIADTSARILALSEAESSPPMRVAEAEAERLLEERRGWVRS